MRIILLLCLSCLGLIGCEIEDYKLQQTTTMELRQMTYDVTQQTNFSGGYFFFAGSISGGSYEVNSMKVFANVDGYYRFININLDNLYIKLDNKTTIPYIFGSWEDYDSHKVSTSDFIDDYQYNKKWYLVCPEKYLPEELNEINLNKNNYD